MREAFAVMCKSFSLFFQYEHWCISDINIQNFNKTFTNFVISFEQLGPGQTGIFSKNDPNKHTSASNKQA